MMTVWHNVLPKPRTIVEREGHFQLRGRLRVSVRGPAADDTSWLARVNAAVQRLVGWNGDLLHPSADRPAADMWIEPRDDSEPGYDLKVSQTRIVLRYHDHAALAHGLATLSQALLSLSDSGQSADLPAVEISDAPHCEWRGFMLDVARHVFGPDSLQRLLDLLWLLRLNRFHLHLTDDQGWRLPVEGYPRLASVAAYRALGTSDDQRYGGSYRHAELRELDRAAADLGITIVPEIDLPGHASAALAAYPDLSCSGAPMSVETRWGIFPAVLCASRPRSRAFFEAVYATVAEVFSGPYIHIGGDEVLPEPWRECSDCAQLANPYQTIVRSMADSVVACGRRPIAWDEAAGLDLPRETIIMNWREPAGAVAALEKGYQIVLSPERKAAYLDHKHLDSALEPGRLAVCTVTDAASFAPDDYVSLPADRGSILGGQANLWTEAVCFHRHVEYMAIARLIATAQGLWSGVPAARYDRFFAAFDDLRRKLLLRGFAVYPGAVA